MISYIGGKSIIGNWIREFIPEDTETYVEPFSGMFWVYFKMDLKKYPNLKTIVYNDYNKLNSNLFKCVKKYDELWDALSKYPCQQLGVSETPKEYKEMFKLFKKEVFNGDLVITEENSMEIAAKYVYVLTQIFSGAKPEISSYTDYKGKYRCKVLVFLDKLKNKKYQEYFDKITFVENLDFQKVIEKYDSPKTFFYTDPPYYNTENYYSKHMFTSETHERLANTLKSIEGKFGLSYYEFPDLKLWYPEDVYRWETKIFLKKSAARKDLKQKKGNELLIMNF